MNRFYRLVWNHALGVLHVVSELAKTASGGTTGKTSPGSTAGNAAALRPLGLETVALPAWACTHGLTTTCSGNVQNGGQGILKADVLIISQQADG